MCWKPLRTVHEMFSKFLSQAHSWTSMSSSMTSRVHPSVKRRNFHLHSKDFVRVFFCWNHDPCQFE
eukprot:UN08867